MSDVIIRSQMFSSVYNKSNSRRKQHFSQRFLAETKGEKTMENTKHKSITSVRKKTVLLRRICNKSFSCFTFKEVNALES